MANTARSSEYTRSDAAFPQGGAAEDRTQQPNWHQYAGSAAKNYTRYLVPAIFEPWAKDLIALAAPDVGERVLDVACGPGVVARLAASHVGATGQVVGLDINPGMLDVARSLPSELPITWHEGNALEMPFPDGSFDLVLCQQGLQFFPDRMAGLREMRRVLSPHGRVVLAVWGPIERAPGFAAVVAALEHHVGEAAAAVARSPFSLWSMEDLRAHLEVVGFSRVEILSRVRTVRFSSPEEFVGRYISASPIATALGDGDPAALEAIVQDVDKALQPYVGDGGLEFPIENHLAHAVGSV